MSKKTIDTKDRKSAVVFEGRIVKTNAIIESSYGFDVMASRLLGFMMSRLNPYSKEFEEIVITVKEIVSRLNITSTSLYTDLEKMSDYMMGLFIKQPIGSKSYKKISVLQTFKYISGQDASDGTAKVIALFHNDMKEHLLDIKGENSPFTCLYLEYFKKLKKKYSYRLYELMKQHHIYRTRKFTLPDIREKLDLVEKYKSYGILKKKVLLPAVEDISQNTDLVVLMDEIRQGKKVVGIKFTWFENNDFLKALSESDVVDITPSANENIVDMKSFVKTLYSRYEESYHLKFDRSLLTISKKEKEVMLEEFQVYIQSNKTLSDRLTKFHKGEVDAFLKEPGTYGLFRLYFSKKILKPKDYDFEEYAKAMGHEVEKQGGSWVLKQPSLFDEQSSQS